jgi:hypothetical protein
MSAGDLLSAQERLIQQWREGAEVHKADSQRYHTPFGQGHAAGIGAGLKTCADELEALLRAEGEPQPKCCHYPQACGDALANVPWCEHRTDKGGRGRP